MYDKPGDVRYTAAWNPESGEVTVIKDLYAGISGPNGSYPAASRVEASAVLFTKGYLTGGDWREYPNGHWVSLTLMA